MRKSFWRHKNVLVTGFEGFLGSHLTKALVSKGAKVVGLDIKTFRPDTILHPDDYRKIKVYRVSVTNTKLLQKILLSHAIDVIFHLAAEAIVSHGRENPRKTFITNIVGTWEVLEAARGYDHAQAIVVASSDKAYGSHKDLPYREDAPLLARHPYDVSKSCADLIAMTYACTYGLPVAVTRCGNIYGPGDFNFSRLVPDAMRSLFLSRVLHIRSDGKFIRDYVYVDDIVNGYLSIAELMRHKKLSGEVFNLGSGNPQAVLELVKKINGLHCCGHDLTYRIQNKAEHEIKEQYLSAVKARRVLGWKPKHSLDQGLKKTARWYWQYFQQKELL
jgi:CDP-glucose 4,6-dehydratase